jgi:chemotaxis protein histidine kinase CheA
MPDTSGPQEFAYSLVEVADQVFAIPLADVVSVQRLKDDSFGEDITSEKTDWSESQVQTVDLRHLLGSGALPDPAAYAVIVSTSTSKEMWGLLVDAIRPFHRTQAVDPLPRLVAPLQWLFAGILRDHDSLIPIVNIPGLVGHLNRATPQPASEGIHAG